MTVLHYYRSTPDASVSLLSSINEALAPFGGTLTSLSRETCFNVSVTAELTAEHQSRLKWLISETFESDLTTPTTKLVTTPDTPVLEFGPRLTFCTAFSSNAVEICKQCGIDNIDRFERSDRYQLKSATALSKEAIAAFSALIHDRMTQMPYLTPIESFATNNAPEQIEVIPIMTAGRPALEKINNKMGLG